MDGMRGMSPEAPEALFAPGEVSRLLGRVKDAFRGHWPRIFAVAILLGLIAFEWTQVAPRIYTSKATVFALPGDGASGSQRGAAGEIVGLSDGAAKVVLSDAALEDLIRSLELQPTPDEARGEVVKKLSVLEAHLGLAAPAQPPQAKLLTSLRKAISVKVQDSNVDITVQWRDPEEARQIAQACVDRLFAARHQIELSPLEAKVVALGARQKGGEAEVQSHQKRLQELIEDKRRGVKASTVAGMQASGKFRDLPDPALVQLRQQILTKRRAIADLEDVRQKRVAEVQAQLAEQSATLGPRNPVVIETRERLRALQAQASRVESLKSDEQRLLAAFVRKGGNTRELDADSGPLFAPELDADDQNLAFEKAALSSAMAELQSVRNDLLDAKLTLESATTTFRGRYIEMIRPESPTRPSSPRTLITCLAAVLVGFLTALLWSLAETRAKVPVRADSSEWSQG